MYTRTSSMVPAKYSPQFALPPIRNGLLVVGSVPATARLATCTPFTYRRNVVPSHVVATCDQVFVGSDVLLKIS